MRARVLFCVGAGALFVDSERALLNLLHGLAYDHGVVLSGHRYYCHVVDGD